jgi:ABC-type multidrug transport system ATPase subunit
VYKIDLSSLPETFLGIFSGNLEFSKNGSAIGLMGANGVGKSTLLGCLKKKNPDFILMDQRDLAPIADISFFTMLELAKKEVALDANELLSIFDVSSFINFPFSRLSGGQRQISKIILTLAINKEVYLLDEPLNFLSEQNLQNFILVVKKMIGRGKQFIVVDHNKEILKSFCEKIYFCDQGLQIKEIKS